MTRTELLGAKREAGRQILVEGIPCLILCSGEVVLAISILTGNYIDWLPAMFKEPAAGFLLGVAGIAGVGLTLTWMKSRFKIRHDCSAYLIHGVESD